MKVQRRNNRILTLALLLTAALALSVLCPVGAAAEELLIAANPESYTLGQTVSIPQGTVTVDGKEHPAQAVVYRPDGTAVSAQQITLEQTGIYTVRYQTQVNGWWYDRCEQFTVSSQPSSISGSPGSTFTYNEKTDSITLELAQKDEFHFNHPIDLKGRTKDDALISLYVTSKEKNVRDFEKLVVVLTDAYDPSNQVYIRLMGDWSAIYQPEAFSSPDPNNPYRYARYQSYLSANFDGGKDWGFWSWSEGKHTVASSYGGGVPVYVSLCNEANLRPGKAGMKQSQDLMILSYDAETNAIYHLGATPYPFSRLVADLDDPKFLDSEFKGFTNGEVYVSLYAEDVYTSANITVTAINSGTGLNDRVVDSTVPNITVDCAPYTQTTAPNAIVGMPYRVFPATVRDINIYDDIITQEVFLNYGAENQVAVDLVDGAFTPYAEGRYTVVYSKADAFGNVAVETVEVTAVKDAKTLSMQVADFTATAGVAQTVAKPTVLTCDEGTGRLALTVTAKRNDIQETVYDGWLDEYEAVSYQFMLAGDWEVTYTLSDHSQSVSETVTCQADPGTSIIYDRFQDLDIDGTFVTGSTYYLPTVQVVRFTETEAIYTDAKIKVSYGDRWLQVLSNRLTVTEDMGDFLLITYYDENNPDCQIFGTRSVLNVGANGSYQLQKLFQVENAKAAATSTYLSFSAKQNASVSLKTKQNAENLALMFQLGGKGLQKCHILLTDSVDTDIQLKITLEKLAKPITSAAYPTAYSQMYLNGQKAEPVNLQAAFGDEQKYFSISYANMTGNVSCTDVAGSKGALTALTCLNGQPFTGFPSGTVHVTFEMEAAGAAELLLYSVNGQSMSSFGEDHFSPAIALKGSYASTYPIGGTVSTVKAQGTDVITGFSNAQITVKRMNGGTVSTVDGKLLEKLDASKSYEFLADQYGEYVVYYYSTDANGNTNDSVYYNFYVEDVEAPSITLVGGAQQTVFTGTEFVMPELSVTDNRSENLYPTAVIVTPDGRRNAVSDTPYVFKTAGSYKVNIVVYDEEGNKAQLSYYVEVVDNEQ